MSITRLLAQKISNYDDKHSLGARLRARRIEPLLTLIRAVFEEFGQVRIIDIGGTRAYWNILPEPYFDQYRIEITIVNLPGTALQQSSDHFRFVHSDGCDLSDFNDHSFHIAHSNSVVEHVGDWSRMLQFANEVKRVAPKYFIQTPNYWFPIEPHCMTPLFHWLPKPVRVWLVMKAPLGNWKKAPSVRYAVSLVESARLLDKPMFNALFDDSRILTERLLFLPKSFIALRE